MKFIVDAQLPFSLAIYMRMKGVDVLHTDDLPNKERTGDEEIRMISISQNRIVITKDTDFLDTYYLKNIPPKLLLVTTGNIKNGKLLELFGKNFTKIIALFDSHSFLEIDNFEIIGHE